MAGRALYSNYFTAITLQQLIVAGELMILCLDVGNSQVYGGLFDGGRLRVQFRRTSQVQSSSDELGVFFRSVLRENQIDPDAITMVAITP